MKHLCHISTVILCVLKVMEIISVSWLVVFAPIMLYWLAESILLAIITHMNKY